MFLQKLKTKLPVGTNVLIRVIFRLALVDMTFSSYDNLASNSQLLSYNEALILSGQATTCSGNMLHSWCIMFGYDPDSPHSVSTSPQLDISRNQRS